MFILDNLIPIILQKVAAAAPYNLTYDLEGLTESQAAELVTRLQAQAPTLTIRLSGRHERVLEIHQK